MQPRYIVQQKITAFANKYKIFTANPDGTPGQVIAFAQQKRLAFKEKVTFYTDESKSQVAFTFRAEKAMDFHGRFFVEDANGALIGVFRKDFTKSLISSTWHLIDQNDQPRVTISESNTTLAVIRRFGGEIPILGILVDLVVAFLKYHFTIVADGQEVGRYEKTTLFRDHYKMSLNDGAYEGTDWRLIVSLAVALDALQGR